MALSDTRTKVVYKPDGTEKRFEVPFQLFEVQDVECITVDDMGAQTRISAFNVEDMQTESGPCVVFEQAPQAGLTLVIRRNTKPVHETEYPEGGTFPSRSVERDISRITAMIQELNEVVDRCIKVNAAEENAVEIADELYLRIHQLALAASDAVLQAGLSCSAAIEAAGQAGEAAAAAGAHGAQASAAAEAAAAVLAQITGLKVQVVTIDCYEPPYGEYDAPTGTLILYIPFCDSDEQGGSFLSDALDGERKALDGVGASEWALGQVNGKCVDVEMKIEEVERKIVEVGNKNDIPLLSLTWEVSSLDKPGYLRANVNHGLIQRESFQEAAAEIQRRYEAGDVGVLTDAAWLQQINATGMCAKFSIGNGSTTFRIPYYGVNRAAMAVAGGNFAVGAYKGGQIQSHNHSLYSGMSGNDGQWDTLVTHQNNGLIRVQIYAKTENLSKAIGYTGSDITHGPIIGATPYIRMYGTVTQASAANLAMLVSAASTVNGLAEEYRSDKQAEEPFKIAAAVKFEPNGFMTHEMNIDSVQNVGTDLYVINSSAITANSYVLSMHSGSSEGYFSKVIRQEPGSVTVLTGKQQAGSSAEHSFIIMRGE